ncbi:hypothetical protein F4678DRAFT_451722 [Xylaria arbuscula]|nr:hypothetical protein F4678DRAFT_451722 [Xylaria arbuscula]
MWAGKDQRCVLRTMVMPLLVVSALASCFSLESRSCSSSLYIDVVNGIVVGIVFLLYVSI